MANSVILIVASFPDSLVKFRGSLISELVSAGCEVHVAVPVSGLGDDIFSSVSLLGARLHNIPLQRTGMNPFLDFQTLFSLVFLIRRIKADCVLGYTVKPVVYGSLAAWLLGVKGRFSLITGLGYAFTGKAHGFRKFLKSVVFFLYRISLSRNKVVFFQNGDDESLFRQNRILPADIKTCVVNGSGVDLSEYTLSPFSAHPSFLLIARLLGDKGCREYVKAAMQVKERYPGAKFTLVGWIDQNPDAIAPSELKSWVGTGAVEYLGRLSDVRPAIAEASVYVLPSYREGTPRTVLEAMAMGRAIITTDAPGCRETVIDGENGFLVPVKSVDALVEAMTRFIEDPALAVRMGKRSREIAEEKYDVHKVNAVMLKEMGIQ